MVNKGNIRSLMVIDKGHGIVGTGFQQRVVQDTSQIEPSSTGVIKVVVKRDIEKRCLGTARRGRNVDSAWSTYLPLKRMDPRENPWKTEYRR